MALFCLAVIVLLIARFYVIHQENQRIRRQAAARDRLKELNRLRDKARSSYYNSSLADENPNRY